eukprot:scaffold4493_cov390-Prasinococcus_capsulatus_cf.AAC.10
MGTTCGSQAASPHLDGAASAPESCTAAAPERRRGGEPDRGGWECLAWARRAPWCWGHTK